MTTETGGWACGTAISGAWLACYRRQRLPVLKPVGTLTKAACLPVQAGSLAWRAPPIAASSLLLNFSNTGTSYVCLHLFSNGIAVAEQ